MVYTGSNEQTQFQIEVDIFIKIISVVAILIGIAFILIGIFAAGASAISMIVFAIGIIVGTVRALLQHCHMYWSVGFGFVSHL